MSMYALCPSIFLANSQQIFFIWNIYLNSTDILGLNKTSRSSCLLAGVARGYCCLDRQPEVSSGSPRGHVGCSRFQNTPSPADLETVGEIFNFLIIVLFHFPALSDIDSRIKAFPPKQTLMPYSQIRGYTIPHFSIQYSITIPHFIQRLASLLRESRFWRWFASYYPVTLVKTADLPPD